MRDELQRYKISANVRGAYKIKDRPKRYELARHEERSWTKKDQWKASLQVARARPMRDKSSSANERRAYKILIIGQWKTKWTEKDELTNLDLKLCFSETNISMEWQIGYVKVNVLNIFWIASLFHRLDDFSENIRFKNIIGFTHYFFKVLVLSSKMDQDWSSLIW